MEDKCRYHLGLSVEYYNENALDFIKSTIDANMTKLYDRFEQYLSYGMRIMDLGCGSGRDSRYFMNKGYEVVAIDPSVEMCDHIRSMLSIPVYQMSAETLSFTNEFDAIWACASLLHVPKDYMEIVLRLMHKALKREGICYGSWKYGEQERYENGRHFSDYNEESLERLLKQVGLFETLDMWITQDVRPDKCMNKWINMIIRGK
ncbi:Methyltransferase domain-containing protein [Lachnospiraceae bacterium XBB2008]|nr:Methyltransferase domain-containing protein [Lachnospiraceae bacterium XBB2008]